MSGFEEEIGHEYKCMCYLGVERLKSDMQAYRYVWVEMTSGKED